jgi:hypothetical protein
VTVTRLTSTVDSSGTDVKSSGGTATGTTISGGGGEFVFFGGIAVLATLGGGGFQYVGDGEWEMPLSWSVAETITVELGVQAAEQEEVEVVPVLAALDNATCLRNRIKGRVAALLIDNIARNDLNT